MTERNNTNWGEVAMWAAIAVAFVTLCISQTIKPAAAQSTFASDNTTPPQTRMEIGEAISYDPRDETGIDFTYDDADPVPPRPVGDPTTYEPDGETIPMDLNKDGVVDDTEWAAFLEWAGL